ncbi:MAG: hypothetical protein QM754_06565 [Tepidisphaeraceae bacterium]
MGLLRLFLAICVLVVHSGSPLASFFVGGPPAVQAFFAISGFYMAMILSEKYPPGRAGTALFWLNRALRLAPTYLLVLAVTVAWVYTRPTHPFTTAMASLSAPWQALVWGVNAAGVGLDGLLFGTLDSSTGTLRFIAHPDASAANSAVVLQLVPQGWSLRLKRIFTYSPRSWCVCGCAGCSS